MPTRTSSARWEGTVKEGAGTISLGSGAYQGAYSFTSRFEDGTGTNPEELIAAAHAGCFSMKLSALLTEAGHAPTSIETSAAVTLTPGTGITGIKLTTTGVVPGITAEEFESTAQKAKETCPVSEALRAVETTLSATLA